MMKRLLPCIFSLLSFAGWAQTDTVQVVDESAVKAKVFSPAIRWDYGKSLTTLAGIEDKIEGSLFLLILNQYFVQADFGQGAVSPENALQNGEYTSEGQYFRVGGGYNIQIGLRSKLALGAQYAKAQFDDYGEAFYTSRSDIQDDFSLPFRRDNLTARWLELLIVSETMTRLNRKDTESKINNLFALGFEIRLKWMSAYDRISPLDVYAVPGFGRTVSQPAAAVNFFIKFYPFGS